MSDIDSVDDKNSSKMDRQDLVWPRYKNTQYVTPDAELKNLIEKGGPGINEPLELGQNLRGVPQVVPAMTESDKLEQIAKNKCWTFQAQAVRCAQQLACRMPSSQSNDVAPFLPSHDLDGNRRSPPPLDFVSKKNDEFIDTIIAVGDTNNKGPVIDYFSYFNLRENGTLDDGNKISVKGFSSKHCVQTQGGAMKKVCKWKIMTADVPLKKMRCLYEVYCFGMKWRKNPDNDTMLLEFVKRYSSDQWSESAQFSDITKAAELVRDSKVTLLEWDMTEDIRGTLDPEVFKQIAKNAGYEIEEDARCGRNCVKIRNPSDTSYKPKAYNKVAETMQQGAVRDQGVSCKFDKLVAPSTNGLKDKIYDPEYYNHGITRLEITFMLDEKRPNWQKMQHTLKKHASMLKGSGPLVTCSIHDHINDMSSFTQRTVIVFFPKAFEEKRRKWCLSHDKGRKQLSQYLHSYPDALLVRWYNRDSSKMNGITINAIHDTRSPDLNGWFRTALMAAACSTSTADPVLFVCVAGSEQWFGQEGPEHMYFRRVALRRVVLAPKMVLDTVFLTKRNLPSECDFANMGVNVDLQPLRPRILKTQQLCLSEIQTDIEIDDNAVLDDLDDLRSDGTEAVCKWSGIKVLRSENLSAEFKPVKRLTIKTQGKHGPKVCFDYEGEKLWVPTQKQEATRSYADNPNINFLVRWGPNGFEFLAEDAENVCPDENEVNAKWAGKQLTADKIPVKSKPQAIKSIGFQQLKGSNLSGYVQLDGREDRYWLPKSITEGVLMILARDSGIDITVKSVKKGVEYHYLDGYFLKHTEEMRERGKVRVAGQPNPEILIDIVDADDEVILFQRLTERGKRKINQIS